MCSSRIVNHSLAVLVEEVSVREREYIDDVDQLELVVPEHTPPSPVGVERRLLTSVKPSEDPNDAGYSTCPPTGCVRRRSVIEICAVDVGQCELSVDRLCFEMH